MYILTMPKITQFLGYWFNLQFKSNKTLIRLFSNKRRFQNTKFHPDPLVGHRNIQSWSKTENSKLHFKWITPRIQLTSTWNFNMLSITSNKKVALLFYWFNFCTFFTILTYGHFDHVKNCTISVIAVLLWIQMK